MAIERTLSIIKPDATRRNLTGQINAALEGAGLRIVAQKRMRLTKAQAEAFYAVHKERPFFGGLVEFMISGPVVVQVLEGENAVAKNREVMGATDPKKAAAWHDPREVRRGHRGEFGAWLRQRRERRGRDRLLLRAGGDRRIGRAACRPRILQTLRAMAYNNAWANHRLLVCLRRAEPGRVRGAANRVLPLDPGDAESHPGHRLFYVDALEGGTSGPAAWANPLPCPQLRICMRRRPRSIAGSLPGAMGWTTRGRIGSSACIAVPGCRPSAPIGCCCTCSSIRSTTAARRTAC